MSGSSSSDFAPPCEAATSPGNKLSSALSPSSQISADPAAELDAAFTKIRISGKTVGVVEAAALQHEASYSGANTHAIPYPSTTGQNLEEFTLFPNLPPELRCKIWKATFPGARIISLNIDQRNYPYLGGEPTVSTLKWNKWGSLRPRDPIALQINQESRQEALRFYEPCFEEDMINPKPYVDFAKDIFWIRGYNRTMVVPRLSWNIPFDQDIEVDVLRYYYSITNFMSMHSEDHFNKIQHLLINAHSFEREFVTRVREDALVPDDIWSLHNVQKPPRPLFGLPTNLKDLMITDAIDFKRLSYHKGYDLTFVDDEDAIPGFEGKGDFCIYGLRNTIMGWEEVKAKSKEIYREAGERNPEWKAPALRFGTDACMDGNGKLVQRPPRVRALGILGLSRCEKSHDHPVYSQSS